MTTTETKATRTQRRRDQIIAAARICFRRAGFHGAGMAEIARHAELSVGQIYRYFVNKDAIIEEIVRRITNNKLQYMEMEGDHQRRVAQFATTLSRRTLPGLSSTREDDHALMLEVTAEATRNPRVAEILQQADQRLFQQAATLMAQQYPHFTADQIAARVELMATLAEGTGFRSVLPPHAGNETLSQLYQHLLHHAFSSYEANE